MPTASQPQGLPFRPASFEDFSGYVRTLRQVLNASLQQCQALLAQIYGYSALHELKAILKTPGAAGPFEEDLRFVAGGYDTLSQRRVRAAKLIEDNPHFSLKTSLELDSMEELVFQLGLFERPVNHKNTSKLISEAVALATNEGWAFSNALKLVTCFKPLIKYDTSQLSAFKLNDKLFDPLVQRESARTYREPYLYLRDRRQAFDLESLTEAGWPGFYPLDDVYPDTRLSDLTESFSWSSHFWEELSPEYDSDSNEANDGAATQEAEDFPKNPDPAVASRNCYLKQFPYVTELAKNFDAIARTSSAKCLVEKQQKRLVLEEAFKLPDDLDIAESGRSMLCSVHLGESTSVDRFDDLVFWDYRATFCVETDSGACAPIALMKGIVIEPYRGKYRVSEHNFQWEMDAHSAMLNDVWKVLTFEFFAKSKYRDLSGYIRECPFTSFAVVDIEIHPDYRGKGLLPSLMQGFLSAFEGQPFTNVDHGWLASGLEREEGWDDFDTDLSEDEETIQVCPPSVLIFPVAGTRPERSAIGPASLLLTGSPAMVRRGKTDPEIENRRVKLESHFLSLREQLHLDTMDDAVNVLVYDPWAYPVT